MDENVLHLLDKHDWTKTIFSLTAFVISVCRWKNIYLPAGLEPEDIAMQAIEKIYEGERRWNPEKDPDLLAYLKSVTRSLISNAISGPGAGVLSLENEAVEEPFYETRPENELYYKQVNEEIAAQMREDPVCALIFKGFKDGLTLAEIAEEYMVDIGEIRKGRRRLLTIATRVTGQLSKSY